MKKEKIGSLQELGSKLGENSRVFLLLYKKGSEQSECACQRLEDIPAGEDTLLLTADVNEVRDIHPEYGITSAPALIEFQQGELKNIYKGCQTEAFYESVVAGTGFHAVSREGKKQKRVTVYTTPTCTWCNTLKTYLKQHNISYTEVDVASNPTKAEEMVRKSGQQGVPQTEIEGQMIIGFDKPKLNHLLEIN
ncbi:MAG: glutaredoxin domain-containing protein [Bacteroidota bacterium]